MDEINRLVTQKLGSTPSSGPSLVGRRIGTYEILEAGKPGDTVSVAIERIGVLTNPVIDEPR